MSLEKNNPHFLYSDHTFQIPARWAGLHMTFDNSYKDVAPLGQAVH